MSFDLGVWDSRLPLSASEAAEVYTNICQNWPYLQGESQQIVSFYRELTERWPEIDAIPNERIDDKNYCPWSCTLNHSGRAVVMSCVWSMADEVLAFVEILARKHKLLLFDPQSGVVSLPDDDPTK